MGDEKVVPIGVGVAIQGGGEVNEDFVEYLEGLLERARSGHAIGICGSVLGGDGNAEWVVCGRVGSFGMIGALEVGRLELIETARGDFD